MPTNVSRYGSFPLDDSFVCENFKFSLINKANSYLYRRETIDNNIKSSTLSYVECDEIIIQPSEPLVEDLPKTLIMLEFEEPLILLPESKLNGFATFPISIAIFLKDKRKHYLIDLFNISRLKFALYGNPHNGLVCRYWKTNFLLQPFETTIFETALLELELENTSSSTIKLTKLILDFAYIRLYYKERQAKTKARAKIQSELYCETEFLDTNEKESFIQTIDLIPTKLLSSSKFIMTNGL